MVFLRSFFFNFFLYAGIATACIVSIPFLFIKDKYMICAGKVLSDYIIYLLKIFMNTKVEFRGLENLKKYEKYFVASSHQSIFETFFLQTIFDKPVFILKKELTKIPLFGWYLKKMGCISIDRNKITKENLNFSNEVGKVIKGTDKILIIFPQGTRKSFDDRSKFKKGFSRIYNDLNIACLPVAINSGKVWPKHGKLIPNQKITVSILNIFPPGIEQNTLINQVEQNIYNELNKIS